MKTYGVPQRTELNKLREDISTALNYSINFPFDEQAEVYHQYLIDLGYDPVEVRSGTIGA